MTKIATTPANSGSLVTLTLSEEDLAELIAHVESSIMCDALGHGDSMTGLELVELAEQQDADWLRQQYLIQESAALAAGHDLSHPDPEEVALNLRIQSQLLRKLLAAQPTAIAS